MKPANLTDDERLHWLVVSRSNIQMLSLEILTLVRKLKDPSQQDDLAREAVGLMIGSAFSLWRAVFLSHDGRKSDAARKSGEAEAQKSDGAQKWFDNLDDGEKFLLKVVKDNSIGYLDEDRWRTWVFGYYTNSARYRIARICEKIAPLRAELQAAGLTDYIFTLRVGFDETTVIWDRTYEALKIAIDGLKARLEKT